MKKKIFAILIVTVVATFAGYNVYQSQRAEMMSGLMLANVEALAGGETGDGETVKCYCKTNWFSSNVYSANGSGAYCGGDPCSNHDGNCR